MLFGMYSQRQKLYIVSNASTNVLNSVFAAVFTADFARASLQWGRSFYTKRPILCCTPTVLNRSVPAFEQGRFRWKTITCGTLKQFKERLHFI